MSNLRDNLVDRSVTKNQDLHGRRIINASQSVDSNDYVIKAELSNYQLSDSLTGLVLNLISISAPISTIRSYTQALLPPANLFPANTLVYVSDYNHILLAVSAVWVRITPNLFISAFLATPDPIAGWHACDSTLAVSYLKKDGTLGTIDMPDANFYPKYSTTYNGPTRTLPVVPTGTNPNTGSSSAVIGNDSGSGVLVTTSGALSVSNHTHTHTDSGHTHTVGNPTISLPGDTISNMKFLGYVRL